ncbi:MAG: aldolase/citrate lyase family protein [Candidatus Omnitrophica bacterium]|nr:aldolase/citrate lyase family protein [Candidatus Omnitrophota bacterium]
MKNIKQTLKERLQAGKNVLGTWCLLPSEAVVNVIAKAGLDFVLIDLEHGAISPECALRMVMAAQADGSEAVIRVSCNDESEVAKALDIGSNGVIVPHIETPRECRDALSFIKYPPSGVRGFSPYVRSGGYAQTKGYVSKENQRILSGIIIEGLEGIVNIDSIIADTRLDLVYIGAYDISVALGVPGEISNPKVVKIIKECVKKIRAHKKAAGALFHSEQELRLFKSIGIQFLCYRVDSDILYSAFNTIVNNFGR